MRSTKTNRLTDTLRQTAHQLTGEANDYDSLIDSIGDARFVLIGQELRS